MAARFLALLIGLLFLSLGIMGFIPALVTSPPEQLWVEVGPALWGYGFQFGWLPTNVARDVLYILLGGAGVLMAFAWPTARLYFQGLFAALLLMIMAGVMPEPLCKLGGLLPLFGFTLLLHTPLAALAWYFGFIYPLTEQEFRPATV